MAAMAAVATTPIDSVRERNRRDLIQAIVTEARRQLARDGAAGLSLRSVSRELGLASSAIYRYVASRDELVTLLVVDAGDAMATAVERAVARVASRGPEERFRAFALALRRWSLAHPNEYALVYGAPVPGHRGAQETARAGSRVFAVVVALLTEAAAAGAPATEDPQPPRVLWPAMTRLLTGIAETDGQPATLPRPVLIRALLTWVELVALIGFELSGQLASVTRTDAFYRHAVNLLIEDLF
jgi:AcrR family transcriptional regulator